MRFVAVVALNAFVFIFTAADAATVEDLFQQFGLFGLWAPNCSQPAAPPNPHATIAKLRDGQITEDSNLGSEYQHNHYIFLSAERLSDTELSVHEIFDPGTPMEERQTLVLLIHDKTRRTMLNQPEGSAVRVKDGVVVASGRPTPVLNKCQ